MSNNYRPQGSEKIQDPDQKLARIKVISGIAPQPSLNEQHKLNTKFSTVLHEAVAADGNTYGLIQEGAKVYLKRLVNDHYEYLTGDEKEYAYNNFATAFKHMNFLFKDISETCHHDNQINIFEGGLAEKKNLTERFVLKTPQAPMPDTQSVAPLTPEPSADMPDGAPPTEPNANPMAAQQLDQELGSMGGQEDPVKEIQKLTGKLTEKMRTADENAMTSEFMKSILNSVISAIDVTKLEDSDLLSIVKKLKGEENPENAGEAMPSGQSDEFKDSEGIDYNVNNPANAEAEPPIREEIMQPTFDDQVMPNILGQVVDSLGVEINPANEEELRQAVTLFVNTYGGDQNQTDFMKQLQDYINGNGMSETVNRANLSYSSLSPMGQEVFDKLELLDPSMGDLSGMDNNDTAFQTPTSNTSRLSFSANESKSFMKDKIFEALKLQK